MKRKKKRVKNYIGVEILKDDNTHTYEKFETERVQIVVGHNVYRIDKTALGSLRINKSSEFCLPFVIMPIVSNVIEIK